MIDDHDEPPFLLTAHDIQSTVWAKLRKHMEARIIALRAKNDGDLEPMETAKVRGELKCLKNLLALGKPDQAMGANDE